MTADGPASLTAGTLVVLVTLVAVGCKSSPSEPPARQLTVVSDRPAQLFAIRPNRRIEPVARLRPGQPHTVEVSMRRPEHPAWPVFLRSTDGAALAIVDAQRGPGIRVGDADWVSLSPAMQRSLDTALAGEVELGMPKEMVLIAWGLPESVPSSARTLMGTRAIWSYRRDGRDVLVYLVDGVVDRVRRL